MSIDVIEIGLAAMRVLGLGLLFGAGLPALFALGMKLHAVGVGSDEDGAVVRRNPFAIAGAYALYAIVVASVVVGVLFVTRHTLQHYFGLTLFGV